MLTETTFLQNCSHLAWVLITVVKKGLTEMTSHLLIVLCGEVCAGTAPKSRASKWRFHCVTVCYTHHPHHHSACTFLTALDPKFTALKWELKQIEPDLYTCNADVALKMTIITGERQRCTGTRVRAELSTWLQRYINMNGRWGTRVYQYSTLMF